jgi:hypothetical protein
LCRLDRSAYRPCSSPFIRQVRPGRHSFAVKAKDAAGNADQSPASFSWRVRTPRR